MSPQVELVPLKPIAKSNMLLAVEPRWGVADQMEVANQGVESLEAI